MTSGLGMRCSVDTGAQTHDPAMLIGPLMGFSCQHLAFSCIRFLVMKFIVYNLCEGCRKYTEENNKYSPI